MDFMALPDRVRVRISSEEGGYVSITPVVSQEIAFSELLERILSVTGKDLPRVQEVLRRGNLVSGASRFRWEGTAFEEQELAAALSAFPDAEPTRSFQPEACLRALLRDRHHQLVILREAGDRRRLFRRRDFWTSLLQIVQSAAQPPVYVEYSYRDHCDVYRLDLTPQQGAALREHAALLRFPSLRAQAASFSATSLELYTGRA
jgi:hypothetical protein